MTNGIKILVAFAIAVLSFAGICGGLYLRPIGVEDEKTDDAVHLIESVCKSRKQMTSAPSALTGMAHGEYTTYPVEVTVGGATLFILSIEQFLKV